MAESEVACGEHLLLSDVGDHHGVVRVGAGHRIDRLAHVDPSARRVKGLVDDAFALDAVAGAESLDPRAVVAAVDALG